MGASTSKNTSSGKKKLPTNFVTWFEIPALVHSRATAFYNYIFGLDLETVHISDFSMSFFPNDGGISGAIIQGEGCRPGEHGPLLYLNGGSDLNNILSKVEEAGGKIIMPKTLISDEMGYFAIFIDSEGNRLALHSDK